jgi:hypothetical protein
MANRHQRRKRAKAANLERTIALASAHRSIEIAKRVKANMSEPRERVYHYGITSTESVLRNAGPSVSASGEIAAMLRRKGYTAR